MQRLHPLPATPPLPVTAVLTVIDEDAAPARRPAAAKTSILEVMPSPAPRTTAKVVNRADDPFEDDITATTRTGPRISGELDFGPRSHHLPQFVPLQPEVFLTGRDPWSVRSVPDLLRYYLPELSISAGLVTGCGFAAGRIAHHFLDMIEVPWIVAVYLALYLLNLASLYFGAKGRSSLEAKESFRAMLLWCFLLCIPHIVAFAILRTGA